MILWRKKTNQTTQDQQDAEDRLIHHKSDPGLEPVVENDTNIGANVRHELNETESEILDTIPAPLPAVGNAGLFGDRTLFPVTEKSEPEDDRDGDEINAGWLSRLTNGLTKSSAKFASGFSDLLTKKRLDATAIESLEELLLTADLGPTTTTKIIKAITAQTVDRDITEYDLRKMLAAEIAKILEPCAKPLMIKRPDNGPFVMLVCGVNGVGKTTTIGKLAKIMHDQKHHKVMMVAGDTFRAAAVEQLQIWGQRAHTPVITRDIGADAAALAYESYAQAKADGTEVVMIDTAGRLHNKANLMAELEKIVRVLKKHNTALPHEVLLVLDGTTGQNAFAQVETFKQMVNVTGLIVTKLDGSAKGGVVVGLADKFGLPIYAVGVGETAEDLQPFTANGYAKALVGLN